MRNSLRPLGALFTDWPSDVADSLAELVSYDFSSLRDVLTERGVDEDFCQMIYDLRSHALEIKNSADKETPLSGPEAVATALGATLSPPPGRWITYSLDASRRRISAPHKSSGSRFVCTITAKVPEPDALPPLPEGGTHLLVRRDTPEVLNIPGVVERIAHLIAESSLADVVLYERSEDISVPSTVYSLRRGQGARGRLCIPLAVEPRVEQKVSQLWL